MKEKIYTIPITDAFNDTNFCPFCYILEKLETQTLEYTMGPSYMESDIRAVSDELGFCNRHFSIMLEQQNKLGIALMSLSHIQKLISDIDNVAYDDSIPKKMLFKKVTNPQHTKIVTYAKKTSTSCYMCNRVDEKFNKYIDSFIHLFINDDNIKNLFINSKGTCYTHFCILLEKAENSMKENEYIELKNIVVKKQLQNLKNLENDLDFFVKKFDYKNADLPWGDKKDILSRVSEYMK